MDDCRFSIGQAMKGCGAKIGQFDCCTVVCGDALELTKELPNNSVDVVITDPVWPNPLRQLHGSDDPYRLFRAACKLLASKTERIVIVLGRQSDPRFLRAIPARFPYLCSFWLRYIPPSYNGRFLLSADVAFAFGSVPLSVPGRRVIASEVTYVNVGKGEARTQEQGRGGSAPISGHPTPRRVEHMEALVRFFADGLVVDPFAGSCTTAVAAKKRGQHFLAFEIDPDYCKIAEERIALVEVQPVLFETKAEQRDLPLIPNL